jgi:hypothetical protein
VPPGKLVGEVAVAVAVATAAVGVAEARLVAAVGVAEARLVAAVGVAGARVGAGVTVGTLAVVGVAPLPAQAARVASSPPMRATRAIPGRASECPII